MHHHLPPTKMGPPSTPEATGLSVLGLAIKFLNRFWQMKRATNKTPRRLQAKKYVRRGAKDQPASLQHPGYRSWDPGRRSQDAGPRICEWAELQCQQRFMHFTGQTTLYAKLNGKQFEWGKLSLSMQRKKIVKIIKPKDFMLKKTFKRSKSSLLSRLE